MNSPMDFAKICHTDAFIDIAFRGILVYVKVGERNVSYDEWIVSCIENLFLYYV